MEEESKRREVYSVGERDRQEVKGGVGLECGTIIMLVY